MRPGKLLILVMASLTAGISDESAKDSWHWAAKVAADAPSSADIRGARRKETMATTPATDDAAAAARAIRQARRAPEEATTPALDEQLEVRGIRARPQSTAEAKKLIAEHDGPLQVVMQKTGADNDFLTAGAAVAAYDAALQNGESTKMAAAAASRAVHDAAAQMQRLGIPGSLMEQGPTEDAAAGAEKEAGAPGAGSALPAAGGSAAHLMAAPLRHLAPGLAPSDGFGSRETRVR